MLPLLVPMMIGGHLLPFCLAIVNSYEVKIAELDHVPIDGREWTLLRE
jgi:hypothetical protein